MTFDALMPADMPRGAGVYLVARPEPFEPSFLESSSAGWFKGRNPSVSQSDLAAAWIPQAVVVYIGKAATGTSGRRGLRKRVTEYRRHGYGENIGHWGGRYIWQLAQGRDLLVAWQLTPGEDPEVLETALIADFVATFGRLPFANRKLGKRYK